MWLLGNAHFESELESTQQENFISSISKRKTYLQLQFLPFLYGNQEDYVLLSEAPPDEYLKTQIPFTTPKYLLYHELPKKPQSIDCWGPSKRFYEFLGIEFPENWDLFKKIQSKAFVIEQGWGLPSSQLIYNQKELDTWTQSTDGKKVLKSCYSYSGIGHQQYSSLKEVNSSKVQKFLKIQWSKNLPVIAQKWIDHSRLFSLHWVFEKNTATCVGQTELFCSPKGAFHGVTPSYPKETSHCDSYIQTLLKLSFSGNLSFDFIQTQNAIYLCEINARKTFGWLASTLKKKHFPNQNLSLQFSKNKMKAIPLLPEYLNSGVTFPYQLYLIK